MKKVLSLLLMLSIVMSFSNVLFAKESKKNNKEEYKKKQIDRLIKETLSEEEINFFEDIEILKEQNPYASVDELVKMVNWSEMNSSDFMIRSAASTLYEEFNHLTDDEKVC